jgi:hypothetical protein
MFRVFPPLILNRVKTLSVTSLAMFMQQSKIDAANLSSVNILSSGGLQCGQTTLQKIAD